MVFIMIDTDIPSLSPNDKIEHAVANISAYGARISCIVDENNILKGVITDGDIRRFIISGGSLSEKCSTIMNTNPYAIIAPFNEELEITKLQNFDIIGAPIVNEMGHLLGILKALGKKSISTPVLIMAGGFGTRLGKLTKNTPKPMVRSNGKPLLEHILLRLKQSGFHNFIISVHYLKEQIIDYFGDGDNLGVNIDYVIEETPLGTGGAITLVSSSIKGPIIVCNGDIITDINFKHFLDFHLQNESRASICLHTYEQIVPYGVALIENNTLIDLKEKPINTYLVNSGIYCVDSKLIELIPRNSQIHMPDVLSIFQLNHIPISTFVSNETWIDFGAPADLEIASKLTF